jgi:hypothetical protein
LDVLFKLPEPIVIQVKNRFLIAPLACLVFASCASLDPDYEEPTVNITAFRALPSEGMAPSFEVGLRILNPNRQQLDIEGIVYTISINDRDIVKGVGKDYPTIEGYSEGDVTVTATASMLEGIKLFRDLMKDSGESLEYAFEAKLDVGGIYPSIKVAETGVFNLQDGAR